MLQSTTLQQDQKDYGSFTPTVVRQEPSDRQGVVVSFSTSSRRQTRRRWSTRCLVLALSVGIISLVIIIGTPPNQLPTRRNKDDAVRREAEMRNQCIFTQIYCHNDSTTTTTTQSQQRSSTTCYIKPSEYEDCLDNNIQLDVSHVVQTIQSLDKMFQQFYPFYYTALDPNKTESNKNNNFPSELGYHLYDDLQVDIHQSLTSIQKHITKQQRASMATFWDMNQVFGTLRDAHVRALQGNIGNLSSTFWSGQYKFAVTSQENWRMVKDALFYKTRFYFDSNDTIQLDLERYDTNGTTLQDTKRVIQLHNWTPMEFLHHLADLPFLPYKSIGPRINALLFRNFPTMNADKLFFWGKGRINPTRILPDDFVIQFQDGTQQLFSFRIALTIDDWPDLVVDKQQLASLKVNDDDDDDDDTLVIETTHIAQQANEPSNLYKHFVMVIHKAAKQKHQSLSSKSTERRLASSRTSFAVNEAIPLELFCEKHMDGWFTTAYNCSSFYPPYDDDGPLEVAYKVMDEYVLLKLDSFDAPPGIIISLWNEMNDAAAKAGVNQLMVDISNNGGGEVPMGLNLAQLMYPEVSCGMFQNKYDVVYNKPMIIWSQVVHPLLNKIENNWFDSMNDTEQLDMATKVTGRQLKNIMRDVTAMCILSLDKNSDYNGDVNTALAECPMFVAAESFRNYPTVQSLSLLLQKVLKSMRASNPWSVASEFDIPMDIEEQVHIRGGVSATFTGFLKHEPDFPYWWNCSFIEAQNVFVEYILVSNGNAGSTTNTFQTTVEQIWKNRMISNATRPLRTLSYGPEDTPLTQYAGGTLEDRVNVEAPFVGLVGMRLLTVLFNGEVFGEKLNRAYEGLHQALPQVPYYLQQFSALPAVEIYNQFMLVNGIAMPLEFVFMPPDIHIQKFFNGGVFNNPEDLADLYKEASQYFTTPI